MDALWATSRTSRPRPARSPPACPATTAAPERAAPEPAATLNVALSAPVLRTRRGPPPRSSGRCSPRSMGTAAPVVTATVTTPPAVGDGVSERRGDVGARGRRRLGSWRHGEPETRGGDGAGRARRRSMAATSNATCRVALPARARPHALSRESPTRPSRCTASSTRERRSCPSPGLGERARGLGQREPALSRRLHHLDALLVEDYRAPPHLRDRDCAAAATSTVPSPCPDAPALIASHAASTDAAQAHSRAAETVKLLVAPGAGTCPSPLTVTAHRLIGDGDVAWRWSRTSRSPLRGDHASAAMRIERRADSHGSGTWVFVLRVRPCSKSPAIPPGGNVRKRVR